MKTTFDILEKFGAVFVKTSGGEQVWQLPNMTKARKALAALGDDAIPFNWCPIQQLKGPADRRKPTILVR